MQRKRIDARIDRTTVIERATLATRVSARSLGNHQEVPP